MPSARAALVHDVARLRRDAQASGVGALRERPRDVGVPRAIVPHDVAHARVPIENFVTSRFGVQKTLGNALGAFAKRGSEDYGKPRALQRVGPLQSGEVLEIDRAREFAVASDE